MSIEAIAWAFTVPDLKTSEKVALVGLANFADEFGVCYPRQDTLCAMCSLGERTLRSALGELEKRGLIGRLERRRADGSKRSDVYLLTGFGRRKEITEAVDHAVLSPQDVVAMRDRQDTKRQDLPVADPDLFTPDQPANPATPTGKSCQTNRQILHDQPAKFAGTYRIEPSEEPSEEEEAHAGARDRARSIDTASDHRTPDPAPPAEHRAPFADFVAQLIEATGHPQVSDWPFWRQEAENGARIAAWRALGLSDARILAVAAEHGRAMPDPPRGPKALDRAMERAAGGAGQTSTGGKARASTDELVAFWRNTLESGRYIAPSAMTSTTRSLLLRRGVTTEADLRARGL